METSQEILKRVEGIQEQINYEVEGLCQNNEALEQWSSSK